MHNIANEVVLEIIGNPVGKSLYQISSYVKRKTI